MINLNLRHKNKRPRTCFVRAVKAHSLSHCPRSNCFYHKSFWVWKYIVPAQRLDEQALFSAEKGINACLKHKHCKNVSSSHRLHDRKSDLTLDRLIGSLSHWSICFIPHITCWKLKDACIGATFFCSTLSWTQISIKCKETYSRMVMIRSQLMVSFYICIISEKGAFKVKYAQVNTIFLSGWTSIVQLDVSPTNQLNSKQLLL